MPGKSLYIIDGHAQIYRAYYAPFGNLSSPTGEPTRAVHVFTQMVLNLLRDRKPDYLVMTLDVDDRTTFRAKLEPSYKATRDESPEDLGPQISRIVSIVEAMNIPILQLIGYEADDLMATICRRLAGPGLDVFLVSRDKDLDQLLNDHVRMYDPGKDVVIDAASMCEAKGYGPNLAVEAQMLIGDSTDNIKGVTGVGPKKAAQLLQKYGSVAGILAHVDEQTPKLRENLLEFQSRMDTVRQLVTLRDDVEFEFDLSAADVSRFDPAGAVPVLRELGLSRLLERIGGGKPPAGGARATEAPPAPIAPPRRAASGLFDEEEGLKSAAPAEAQAAGPSPEGDLFGGLFETIEQRNPNYVLIDAESALAEFAAELSKQRCFAFDTETTGLVPAASDLCGISIAFRPEHGVYIAIRGDGPTVSEEAARRHLGPIFANPDIKKCGQNLKYDAVALKTIGIEVAGIECDSMIASFVLEPERRSHGIDHLARELLRYQKIATTDLLGKGKSQTTFDRVPTARTCQYACEDADIAWRLCELFTSRMTEPELCALFRELEMPLVDVLAQMEHNGVALDTALLADISRHMADRLAGLEHEIHAAAGHPFNISSTQQLAEVLFDELKLRVVKRTRTLRSTDAEVLETLANESDHPLPKLVLDHRELSKLKGTYVDALPAMVNPRTGRVHPSFHQTGAITGRLSCSDPNLQNIPIRTDVGAQIRRAFIPGIEDYVLIKADYSQIELRILAHFSGDETLCRAFADDQDIHAFVAAQLAGIPVESVSKEQRSRAKTVNFGIIYGQSAFGLARQTGMSQAEARDFIDRYFKRYPRIRAFLDGCIEHARTHGYVKTMLGRRRNIAEIHSRNQTARNAAERFACNTVIQGTAADMIKRAMVNIHRRILRESRPSRMLIQVHDELVFEAPKKSLKSEAAMIEEEMSQAMPLRVPVKVDVSAGPNWLDAQPVK